MSHKNSFRSQLRIERLEVREVPAAIISLESFDALTSGIPSNWRQLTTAPVANAFSASPVLPFAGPSGLVTNSASGVQTRAWIEPAQTADYGAAAMIFLNSSTPVDVIARGTYLATSNPTYYSVSVSRGMQVSLTKVVNGSPTVLGSVTSRGPVSNQWMQVAIVPNGNQIRAEIYDPATGRFLNAMGDWQPSQCFALTAGDTSIPVGGRVGIGRRTGSTDPIYLDNFAVVADSSASTSTGMPTPQLLTRQDFNSLAPGSVPAGWNQWSSDGSPAFSAIQTGITTNPGLISCVGPATRNSLLWPDIALASNQTAGLNVLADTMVPSGVFVRGSGLNSATPTYYSATVTRGGTVTLSKTIGGQTTVLATLAPSGRDGSTWYRVQLNVDGDRLRVRLMKSSVSQYLGADGRWTFAPTDAINLRDSSIAGAGRAGIVRLSGAEGGVRLDDFESFTVDNTAPTVALTSPAIGSPLVATVPVQVDASDETGIAKVEYFIGSTLQATLTSAPFVWPFNTRSLPDGNVTLTVKAYDGVGNVSTASRSFVINNTNGTFTSGPAQFNQPTIPRHYDHIRVAQLAWFGTPFTSFEQGLLRDSVDVVLPNEAYVSQIASVAPNTPQLLYTNLSNIYQNLLADWLIYADSNSLDRENAFYHVPAATAFQGGSPGAQPVNWLWDVRRESTNLTSQARSTVSSGDVTFGQAGQSVYMGDPDPFRELNIDLQQVAASAWSGRWEYPSAVNAQGQPTQWKTLSLNNDGTNSFRQSGQITFDPPADWKPADVGAGQRYYYVRVLSLSGGLNQPPVARWILGRDYVNATYSGQSANGTIPAFDAAADVNGDNYLSDAEYANRAAGKDARFRYESRLFYPYYGQMRFVTNPAGVGFNAWAANFHQRLLASNPLAAGIHLDNSNGKSPVAGINTIESATNYTADYASLVTFVGQAIAPKWMSANTVGGNNTTDAVVRTVQANYEEFTIRPMQHNTTQFEDLAAQTRRRQSLTSPTVYTIIDSLLRSNTTGLGGPTDPRAQIGALAYYYLIGNPDTTFFMMSGGDEPSTSWTRHWTDAIKFNVGKPTADWDLFAMGADPANNALNYKVYGRNYDNALVLFKPISYKLGVGSGTLADATATTHALSGTYRPLQADGTLGAPVTSITLRNGEGAILVRA